MAPSWFDWAAQEARVLPARPRGRDRPCSRRGRVSRLQLAPCLSLDLGCPSPHGFPAKQDQPPVVGPPPVWGPLWQMGSGGRGTRPLCATDWLASCSRGHPGLAQVLLTLKVRWLTEAGMGTLASGYPHGLLAGSYHGCPGKLAARPGTRPPGSSAQVARLVLSFLLLADFCGWARRCSASCLLRSGCSGFLGSVGLGGSPALVHSCVQLWGLGGSQGLFGGPAVSPPLPPLGSLGVEGALLEPS